MEEEFVSNQERLKPQEERNEEERTKVCSNSRSLLHLTYAQLLSQKLPSRYVSEVMSSCTHQVDELRGSPMSVGSLEEIIDEKCVLHR